MIEIKLLPNSEVEIIGEISAEIFMSGRSNAIKEFSEKVEMDGFRKGKIPEDILIKNIGIVAVLEKMAVIALEKEYPKIISEHKVRAIGRPEITLTKLAENNPLGFKVTTSALPEITLPDYKSIAKKIMAKKEEVSEENKAQEKERRRMEIFGGSGKRQNGRRNEKEHRSNGFEMGRLSETHQKNGGRIKE